MIAEMNSTQGRVLMVNLGFKTSTQNDKKSNMLHSLHITITPAGGHAGKGLIGK